nr:MAG TPA: hypothetical protein [Caudoviricetes sp.]
MTLFLFILGLVAIFCISRYNESNRLFWTLLVAYVSGFTAARIITESFEGNKDKVCKISVKSTQLSNGLSKPLFSVTDNSNDALEIIQNAVSKTNNIDILAYNVESLPKILNSSRLLKPPNKISTRTTIRCPYKEIKYHDTS